MEKMNILSLTSQAFWASREIVGFILNTVKKQPYAYGIGRNGNKVAYSFELDEIDFLSFTFIIEKLSNECDKIHILDTNEVIYEFNYFNIKIYY